MTAIILCGGLGTRLRSVVSDKPKSMADINGKPFLQYQIEYLKKYGIKDFVFATGYLSEKISDYFKDGSNFGIHIEYAKEDEPLGTGGAIKNAFKKVKDDYAICLNGDTYFEINVKELEDVFTNYNADMAVAIKYEKDMSRFGAVKFDNNKLISWNEKDIKEDGFINGGIYVIGKSIVDAIPCGKVSLENDLMPHWINTKNIVVKIFSGHSIDIGIPESLEQIIKYFKLPQEKVVFLDRDGTINEDRGYTVKCSDLKLIPSMVEKIKEWKKEGYIIIVVTNQSGIARGYYKEEEVHQFNKYLNEKLGNLIDGFYISPYHIDSILEEYKKDSYCRKPNPGMLIEAESDLEKGQIKLYGNKVPIKPCRIDKEKSFMCGDNIKDIECAENFGIKGIKV